MSDELASQSRSNRARGVARELVLLGLLGTLACIGLWAITVQPFVGPSPPISPATPSEAELEADVRFLSQSVYPRSFDQIHNLNRAAEYISARLTSVGAHVHDEPFQVEDASYRNIVADFGPPGGSVIIVGAHYDSESDVGVDPHDARGYSLKTHTPGADDNASGIAVLIQLAKYLVLHPPSRPIQLVAFTLEEPPHFGTPDMGSARHAAQLRRDNKKVRMMVSLEMLGYFSDAKGSQHYPTGLNLFYPDRGNFIAVVGRWSDWRIVRRAKSLMSGASSLPVMSINAPRVVPGIDLSDNRNYWDEGYPALMVTDTAFYRNLEYHASGDVASRLDYRKMADVARGVSSILAGF